jgi:hypothetical protein
MEVKKMSALLITDQNADEQLRMARARLNGHELYGVEGCKKNFTTYGCIPGVQPASFRFPRIPREQWREILKLQKGTFLGDFTRGKLPPHDQGRTNYCWGHGSVRSIETLSVFYGQQPTLLSAESVCVPVTGGKNRGGSPEEALNQLIKFGCCEQSYWPHNELDVRKAKEGWQHNALSHRILQWVELENFDDQMTLAIRRQPVAIGLGWWGHLVCQLDPVFLDDFPELDSYERASGGFGIGFDNSWGAGYGDNGYAYLDEKHATSDLGAFSPIGVTFAGQKNSFE